MASEIRSISSVSQILLGCAASSVALSGGMMLAFSGVALESLSCTYSVDKETESWIVSLPQLFMIAGSLVVGPLTEIFGRKVWLIVSSLFSLAGWISVGVAPNPQIIFLGRSFNGFGAGLGSASISTLLAELTDPSTRGPLSVFRTLSFSVGVTLMYIIGYFFKDNWQKMAFLSALAPAASIPLVIFCVPESSVWIKSQKSDRDWMSDLKKVPHRPEVYKPLILMNFIYFLRQMSGTTVIISYTVDIIAAAGYKGDPYLAAISLGVARILAGLLAVVLSGMFGRRPPISYSGAVMCFSMLLVSAYVRWPNSPVLFSNAIVACLFVYVFSSTVFSAITQSMLSEVFPSDLRGVASGMSLMVIYLSSFIAMKIYPFLLITLKRVGMFSLFSILCVVTTLVCILFLPETHKKTFKEIEEIFIGVKKGTDVPEGHPMLPVVTHPAGPDVRNK